MEALSGDVVDTDGGADTAKVDDVTVEEVAVVVDVEMVRGLILTRRDDVAAYDAGDLSPLEVEVVMWKGKEAVMVDVALDVAVAVDDVPN